jgi:DNA-binding transcriptional ArsR family regulator
MLCILNHMVKYKGNSLDRKFHALSDETRRKILIMVLLAERAVSEISAEFSISMPAISRHLRVLEDSGLITRRIYGRNHFITGDRSAFKEVSVLVNYYETFWTENLNSLAKYLEE